VNLDLRDGVFVIGLVVLAAGLYGVDWRLSAAAVGAFLIYLGLFHWREEGE
jgi:hypothetical protein